MVDINEVAENLYLIDNQMLSMSEYGSTYLLNEEKKALIEAGPATSLNVVLAGIKRIGIRPEDIDYVIVTHIHLDHAGGAGVLLKYMPQAQVIVHHRGARHLVDPTKLVSSVGEVQGEEAMTKWGEVVPVAAHRVQAVHEGDTIKLGEKQVLNFIDAPGHAPHQLCIHETRNGGLFVGDAVGMYVAEGEVLVPITPPPNFNLELYVRTLERLMKMNASLIYFSHFGVSNRVKESLKAARSGVRVWDDIVAKAIEEGAFSDASNRLIAQACVDLEPIKKKKSVYEYLTKSLIHLSAAGYTQYYRETMELN